MNDAYPEHTLTQASKLYTLYCEKVGGKAFNGDPLPTWDAFVADPNKLKQAQAWCEVGAVLSRAIYASERQLCHACVALEAVVLGLTQGYDFKKDESKLLQTADDAIRMINRSVRVPTFWATGTTANDVSRVTEIRLPELETGSPLAEIRLAGFDTTLQTLSQVESKGALDEAGGVQRGRPVSDTFVPPKPVEPTVHPRVAQDKRFRKDLDEILQRLKRVSGLAGCDELAFTTRNRTLACERIEDAIMRLGMDLKEFSEQNPEQGTPDPYPHSYNPESPVIEKTADDLKL